ncbi:predicted protein [Botrytis cinerea T4]|uniref:Uncharacterized protein n=1 Tax=Botryotinia fuckeliana (strain T4) TaxID=999810 RepID=G2YGY8_BOTF4|nr:predicted protein [Botrytis cinerea T4]
MGLTIANKDLLLSSADPNALPIYADIKSLKNSVYEIGLKVRAREMENAIATRTSFAPREKFTSPGNHAAHAADAFADAQMVLETDSKTEIGRVISGKREQFKLTCLVAPETVIKFANNRVYSLEKLPNAEVFDIDETAFKKFDELYNVSRELRDKCRKLRRENPKELRRNISWD